METLGGRFSGYYSGSDINIKRGTNKDAIYWGEEQGLGKSLEEEGGAEREYFTDKRWQGTGMRSMPV